VIHCETCSYYFARYPAMLHAIKTPEAPPDRKLAIKLKLLLDSRFGKQKEEESNKICLYCGSHYRLYHYYRVPTLGIEQCPKGCGVLIPLSNLKKMQALEQMGNKWEASEIPFPPLP
jgi:hypothetical protein